MKRFRASVRILFLLAYVLQPTPSSAQTVAVRYPEGVSHGFLVLRTQEGKPIADGESMQVARGDRITSHMRFRFTDGSLYEQTTVFSQHGTFRLLSDHVIQKGPTFKRPMEIAIDATSGQVTVRYTDDGKEKVLTQRLELPPDVSNGILLTLLKNVQRSTPKTTVSYVAATPKPRLVKLEIIPQGQEPFSVGSYSHKAIHYVVKVKTGGVTGVVAHLVGKQPPDTQVWVLGDNAPAFVRSEGPLYDDGPTCAGCALLFAAFTYHLQVRDSHVAMLGRVLVHSVVLRLALRIFLHTMHRGIGDHAGDRNRMTDMIGEFESSSLK